MKAAHEIRRENLRALVNQYGSVVNLANKLERSSAQISQWLNASKNSQTGKPRTISDRSARFIEETLELPRNWLDHEHSEMTSGSHLPDHPTQPDETHQLQPGPELGTRHIVPVVGTAEGGPDRQWEDLGYPVGYGSEYVDAPSRDPNAYALLVSGNSMAPRMRPGEAILVEPNHEPQPGDEVVVRLKDGSTMVKIFSARRGGRIYLDSIGDHDTIVAAADEIEFMHYVAGVFRAGSIKERGLVDSDAGASDEWL